MRIYLRYLKSERIGSLLFAIGLFGFGYILVVMYPSFGKLQALKNYFEMMPVFLKALLGDEIIDFTTLKGFMTVEFFNTTWLFVTGVFSCLLAGSLVAEETEKKTLEILLSTAVTRTGYIISKFAGFLTLLVFLATASFLGLYLGMWRIGEQIDEGLMFYAFFTGTICMAAMGSIGLLFSCLFNEQRRAISMTLIVFFSLYLFNLFATFLEQYPRLKYFALFHYYDASKIFKRGAICWPDIGILLAVFTIVLISSIFTFRRKDIYI
ncbi:MAG: ABC transporter permease subunit [Phycisphaerales bacterium]|nr:MAG: ABC transporter permease subunit [Phycisphaerales bacterium]